MRHPLFFSRPSHRNIGDVPGDDSADFNGDGRVDLADFAIMRANFGFGVPSAPEYGATIPEPATLTLLALGGLAMLRRTQRVVAV